MTTTEAYRMYRNLRRGMVGKVSFMSVNELRKIIREAILEMERPFNVSDLFYKLDSGHGVQNRTLILEVLDELCDSGAIDYSEINDDCWAFNVVKTA